jgi:steroid delta-isomerase-like uncharacterized protein
MEGPSERRSSVSREENKEFLARSLEALFNEKRVDDADEFYAADYVDHSPFPGQPPGLEGAKKKWSMYIAAIPDLRATVEDMVAEREEVAVRWTVEGTHRGELLGIPPTGRHARITGISIYRLTEGKIAEQFERWDRLDLMQQLGVIPTPGQTG